MINFVDKPQDLLEQLDNLRYFVEKKMQQDDENKETLRPVNKQTNKQVTLH